MTNKTIIKATVEPSATPGHYVGWIHIHRIVTGKSMAICTCIDSSRLTVEFETRSYMRNLVRTMSLFNINTLVIDRIGDQEDVA